jgi:hypothetical protein
MVVYGLFLQTFRVLTVLLTGRSSSRITAEFR